MAPRGLEAPQTQLSSRSEPGRHRPSLTAGMGARGQPRDLLFASSRAPFLQGLRPELGGSPRGLGCEPTCSTCRGPVDSALSLVGALCIPYPHRTSQDPSAGTQGSGHHPPLPPSTSTPPGQPPRASAGPGHSHWPCLVDTACRDTKPGLLQPLYSCSTWQPGLQGGLQSTSPPAHSCPTRMGAEPSACRPRSTPPRPASAPELFSLDLLHG